MGREIEVKYRVKRLPADIHSAKKEKIRQGYLVAGETENVVRIRQKGEGFFLTVKGSGHLSRSETEIVLNREQFDALWPLTDGKRIEKTRFYFDYADRLIELDIFEEKLEGLQIAEVEFESGELAAAFVPPDWFGAEVTFDSRYQNNNLALKGKPENQ